MKYRKSFVTNSSSSSYICEHCKYVASGWDMCLSDAEMFECENGHTFCQDHCLEDQTWLPKFKEFIKAKIRERRTNIKEQPSKYFYYGDKEMMTDEELDDAGFETLLDHSDDLGLDIRYHLPAELCIFCNLNAITDSTIMKLLLKDNNINREQLAAIIQKRFGNYENLSNYLQDKKEGDVNR